MKRIITLATIFLCLTAIAVAQPSNDDCNGAITLTSNTSCSNTSGTVANATADNFPNQATCDVANPSLGAGVFYKFTAAATTETITVTPTGTLDAVLVLYSGGCFGLSQVGCIDQSGGNGVVTALTVNNLTIGQQYIIRVYDYGAANATSGGFNICVTHQCQTPAPPTGIDNSASICQGASGTYFIGATGANPFNWHWYSGSCGGTPVGTGDHIDVDKTTPGSFTYYVRTENSCGNSNCLSTTLTVVANVTPGVTISPASTTAVCSGQTVTFTTNPTNGGNAPTYQWYLDANSIQGATSATYTTPSLASNATVYCIMRSNASCTEPDDMVTSSTTNITVNALPNVSLSASSNNITTGQSVTLTASGANSYAWSNGLGTNQSATTSPTSTTTYTVTGTSNGCSATASATVTVTPSTGVEELNITSLNINPNPSAGTFNISFETTQPEQIQIKIFSATGQLVKEEAPVKVSGAYTKAINLGDAPKGIYLLQIKAADKLLNRQIQIQ